MKFTKKTALASGGVLITMSRIRLRVQAATRKQTLLKYQLGVVVAELTGNTTYGTSITKWNQTCRAGL